MPSYARAIEADPTYAKAYKARGLLRLNALRDQPGALADFDAYLRHDHDDPTRPKIERLVDELHAAMGRPATPAP